MLHGIDIAANNGLTHIGLAQDFGIVKSTESTNYHNPNHPAQTNALRKAGKLVGHYHFLHTLTSGRAQAKWFIDNTTVEDNDIICLDMEQQVKGVPVGTPYQRVACAEEFLTAVWDHYQVMPFIYSYPDYLHQLGTLVDHLHPWPLWIAEYNGKAMVDSRDMYGWKVWTMHQDADQPYVDRDVFNGDRTTWNKLSYHPWQPPAKPVLPSPKPSPEPQASVTIMASKNVHVKVVQ